MSLSIEKNNYMHGSMRRGSTKFLYRFVCYVSITERRSVVYTKRHSSKKEEKEGLKK